MAVAAPEAPETNATEIEDAHAIAEPLQLPMIDGQGVDRIEVKFNGGVRLDRSDAADCALMRQLVLGREITLKVVGTVSAKPFRIVHDEDGYPGEVTMTAAVRVTTLYRPVGENGEEARAGQAQLDLDGTSEANDEDQGSAQN